MMLTTYCSDPTWTRAGNYTGTDDTSPWTWGLRSYVTTISAWKSLEIVVPKWWRWFDVFRIWAEPKVLRLLALAMPVMLRAQERYPMGQRRRQKRRAYVQRLAKQIQGQS